MQGQPQSSLAFNGLSDFSTAVYLGSAAGGEPAILTSHDSLQRLSVEATVGTTISGKTLTNVGSIPTINDRNVVSFVGLFQGGSGVFTQTHLLAQTGENIDGQELTAFASIPMINDFNTVVFLAGIPDNSVGVFTQRKLLARIGDTIGGQILTGIDEYMSEPAIDDFGTVYFEATIASGYGIFTQSSLIVKTGDVIGGKTVTNLSELSVNKLGNVIFNATFSDSSQAIILAEPSLK